MSLRAKRELIEAVLRAWSEPDLETLTKLLTEDCEWRTGWDLGLARRTLAGRDAIAAYVAELHDRGKVERRLVDVVEGTYGVATLQAGESTAYDGSTRTAGASFSVFVFEEDLVKSVTSLPTRSQVLTRIGMHGRDREDALVVRDWSDPRVSRFRPEDPLVGRQMRYQRFFGSGRNDHRHCEFCWRKIMNIEQDGVHRSGYAALDPDTGEPSGDWVCEESFDECRDLFGWEVVPTPPEVV